jgi:hypothetical protein
MLSAIVFIYFKEYSDTKQSLTYPSEKLVVTVGTSVTTGDYDGRVVVVVIYLTSLSVTQEYTMLNERALSE